LISRRAGLEAVFEFFSCLLAGIMLIFIAFPQYFVPQVGGKRKKVGSSYWGVYEGESPQDLITEKSIEIPKPARKWIPIAGSSQYASGKGISKR
jgi:hypothetical protein